VVAADSGYCGRSGIHRLIQRLQKKADVDQALAQRLRTLAEEVSRVKSYTLPASWFRHAIGSRRNSKSDRAFGYDRKTQIADPGG
jgi:hypothetical protein